jgi:hypothetical protein
MAAARKKRAPARKSARGKKRAAATKRPAGKKTSSRNKKSASRKASSGTRSKNRVLPNDKAWRELLERAIAKDK